MKKITLLLTALVFSTVLFAQQEFEGKLTFKLSMNVDSMEGLDKMVQGIDSIEELTGIKGFSKEDAKEMMRSMIPKGFEYLVGKEVLYFKVTDGTPKMMQKEMIYKADGSIYYINHADKSYTVLDNVTFAKLPETTDSTTEASKPEIKVELLEGTEMIQGLECKKYKVEFIEDGETTTQMLWITDKYKLNYIPYDQFSGMSGEVSLLMKAIEGIPLKAVVNDGKGMIITLEVTSVDFRKLPKKAFDPPKGYKKLG